VRIARIVMSFAPSRWGRRQSRVTSDVWSDDSREVPLIARNVATEYVRIGVNVVLGAVMLPFNVHHLGQAAYGLWILVTSLTTYFSILDLGYGSAQVKFAAEYRARRDAQALNEIASTLFFLFLGFAVMAMIAAWVLAANLGHIFKLTPDQLSVGRKIFLIVSLNVALGLPFSVFGGIVNGFQRYDRNNLISLAVTVLTALANVVVLLMGYGIVELVACTTAIRLLSLLAYRRSAYKAFPLLSVRWSHARLDRLREVTGFSVFLLIIDIANKINYAADDMVIGAVMGTAAIAVWSVGARLIDVIRTLTQVFSRLLFSTMVDSGTRQRTDRLRLMLIEGTRLSLATALPMASVAAILAEPLVQAWVGPRFNGTVPVIWILAVVVTIRIGTTTAMSMLRGCGQHRLVAWQSIMLAVTNVVLSIVFARRFGLPGVALGTLLPVSFVSLFVFVPAACRRAEVPVSSFVRTAVWPTVWPMIPVGIALWMARGLVGSNLISCGVASVAAGFAYAVLVAVFAIDGETREWYSRKLVALYQTRGRLIRAPLPT
jgi:O-antigen/teichoic acid export membrane protein